MIATGRWPIGPEDTSDEVERDLAQLAPRYWSRSSMRWRLGLSGDAAGRSVAACAPR